MAKLSPKPIPTDYQRIVLVNPTRYLGNLLIAGGLIQDFQRHCAELGRHCVVVLDESYRTLVQGALPDNTVLYYPRGRIARARGLYKMGFYLGLLRSLRAVAADIAFNIEEDSVSGRLTQFSGAGFRLGCSSARHRRGYEHVLPVEFVNRPAAQRHRWYSFQEVFAALGLPPSTPGYMRLAPPPLSAECEARLAACGVDPGARLALIHAGATKDYKKWPEAHFVALVLALSEAGLQPAFIGAGADAPITARILAQVAHRHPGHNAVNLCNRLSLVELAAFFRQYASAIIGNDSGPFHLAAALGVPGVVLFGPTDVDLWAPLAATSVVLKGTEPCAADCTRRHCLHAHRCLTSISPENVVATLLPLLPPR